MIYGMDTTKGTTPTGRDSEEQRLKRAARQLEGVFVQQLFKAMRETVPAGELGRGGSGEEMFTGLMDQQLADSAAPGTERGLGAALYRQLRARIAAPAQTSEQP